MLTEFLLSLFIPFVGLTQGTEAKKTRQSEQVQKVETGYKGEKRTPLSPVEEALRNLRIKEESAKFHTQMCYDALQEAELKKPVSLDEINEMLEDLYKKNKEVSRSLDSLTGEESLPDGGDNFLFAVNEELQRLRQLKNSNEENMQEWLYIKWMIKNREALETAANTSAEYAKTVCEEAKLASDRVEEAKSVLRRAVHNFMNFIARNN